MVSYIKSISKINERAKMIIKTNIKYQRESYNNYEIYFFIIKKYKVFFNNFFKYLLYLNDKKQENK